MTVAAGRVSGVVMGYGRGVLLVFGAGVLWSFMGLFIRQIEVAGTEAVVFWRSIGLILAILGFLWWRHGGRIWSLVRGAGLAGAIGGLGLTLAYLGAVYAIQTTTVANAVFLFAISPFLSALLGLLVLRERVAGATWGAMALAGVGIFVMIGASLGGGSLAGNAAALVSALGFAAFAVALRWGHMGEMMPAVLLGGCFSIFAAALLAGARGQPLMVPLPDVLWSLAMGMGILAGGMVLFTLGSRKVPAAEATLFAGSENILAPFWVWLLMGEGATTSTWAGGALVLAAVTLNAAFGIRRNSAGAAEEARAGV